MITHTGMTNQEGRSTLDRFPEFPTQKSRTAFALDAIVGALREGRYAIGDRLPSERILAEQLEVGRAAIREALSALQVMGIVERRVGDGTYVLGGLERAMSVETALHAVRENQSLGAVWEARKILEVVLAELAVQKATPDDLEALRDCVARIEVAIAEESYDDYADADRDFHLALGKAAKNPFLEQAQSPILAITHQQVATQVDSAYIAMHGPTMLASHEAVLDALEKRDKAHIRRVVEQHFVASERLFVDSYANEALEE
jgi:GntR family transcriptional regulator, transcriptional repressor for pyruvate dehydrogenase complex